MNVLKKTIGSVGLLLFSAATLMAQAPPPDPPTGDPPCFPPPCIPINKGLVAFFAIAVIWGSWMLIKHMRKHAPVKA